MFPTFIVILASLFLGFIAGVVSVVAFGLSRLRKADKARLAFAQGLAKSTKEIQSAKERINKAFDICERQFEIFSGLEGPQSGPMHGWHKQIMGAELKRLEEEKMTILRSVLADGYNPKLIMINENGEREAVKLSDFIERRDLMEQSKGRHPSAPAPEPQKKRLSLVKSEDTKK